MGFLSAFKNIFALTRAKMKQSSKNTLPDVPDLGTLGSGGRMPGRVVKTGPALRKFRKERKVRNKMAARSRRVNQARREGVSI
uniref:Uncharacterized protein n=1 Tax=viral metagenome TaxID=1070528 RepID=A0A6M3LBA8_9ZZZZ